MNNGSALRIYFRQHQLLDSDNGNAPVVVDCGTIATYVPGTVDPTWYEMSKFTEGLDKFTSSWDAVNVGGDSNEAGSNYDKGVSLSLTFSEDAFTFIWDWLLTTKCQILNSIDVRIDDVLCEKSYRLFEIKCDNLSYKPELPCKIECALREQDLTWHCIHKTFIWDNWQNWFNQDGTSTKDHPTFLTCIEPRPRLLNSARMAMLLFIQSHPALNLINFITNGDIKDDTRRLMDMDKFQPAPLIRTYIDNVAGKCGLSVDTIFHRIGTPEYNACLFHPITGAFYENDGNDETSPSTKYLFENRWNVTLAELLDFLKKVYAAEWYVTPGNTIVFKPVVELINLSPIYDFTNGVYPVNKLSYSFSGTKKPAYGRYQYTQDGSDLGSQEISVLYNDLTDFDGPSNNPMLEGELSQQFQFAPTAFVRDGRTDDYIRKIINDAEKGAYILVAVIYLLLAYAIALAPAMAAGGFPNGGGAIALGVIIVLIAAWPVGVAAKANSIRNYFTDENGSYTGAVRMVTANQTLSPRILIWDGASLNRAKVVKTNNPTPDPYYNPDLVPYPDNNPISTDNPGLNVFNYQSYFDSKYQGNLYDRFHDEVDNPLKSLETNQTFSFETDLCCGVIDLLGLWADDFVKIGYLAIIEKRENYDVYGRVAHIEIDYDTYTVRITGKVIKK